MNLKQLAYQKINKFGLNHSDSMKYINWSEEQIYIILWCNRFLMFSTHEENFETLHGVSEIENKEKLFNFLKSYEIHK